MVCWGFFVARSVSPWHDRLVFDQNVQEEECCISSCQPLTFPEVISQKDRKGRKEGSVITDSKAIVCEAIRQLNSCVNLPYLTSDFNEVSEDLCGSGLLLHMHLERSHKHGLLSCY